MLLKSLDIQGFKTFPDKTALTFDRGITAVVGPNGSGKSNISDAVRWVLGEQSARILRCSKMEDVIFNGTPERRAQGFAEVTLNIDNTSRDLPFDSDSVAVTRRYYRSGESEYLINKNAVRLRDINELFMDTGLGRDGYSIIGQGKIDSIVAARSEDRREIFEEAAGISRFRYRREESERRLNQAEENLLRLRDIMAELESRVGPLREQAEKAEQYLALAAERKTLEIGLWLETLDRSGRVLREYDDKILLVRNQYEEAEAELSRIDAQINGNFSSSNACAAKADEFRQKAAEQEEAAAKQDTQASVLQNDILHNRENMERIRREMEENDRFGRDMDGEVEQKRNEIQEKNRYIEKKNQEAADCADELEQARRSMDDTAGKIDALTRRIAALNSRSTEVRVAEMTAASAIAEMDRRLSSVEETVREKRGLAEKLKKDADDYAKMCADADARIASMQNAVKGYELRLDTRRGRMEERKKQSDRLKLDAQETFRRAHLLEELERNLEGFSHSVKIVMKEAARKTLSGIHGPVSRLIHVPQKYAVAVETALGGAMQHIVVGNEQDAKRAIALLKQKDSGRATFLPLSVVKGNVLQEKGLDDFPGFVGMAGRLCSCGEQYRGVLDSLLGRIAVAENLDSAVAIARRYGYRFRVVTLDGQVVNAGGSMTGGSLAKNSGLLRRAAEIEQIRAKAEELSRKAEEAAAALKTAEEEVSSAEAALGAAKGELASAREERYRIEAERKRALDDEKTVRADLETLEQERKDSGARRAEQERIQKEAQEEARTISGEMDSRQAELDAVSGSRGELNRKADALAARLQEIRMDLLSAQKDMEALKNAVEEMQKRKADRAGHTQALRKELAALQDSGTELNARIAACGERADAFRKEAERYKAETEALGAKRMEYERRSTGLRAKEREQSDEREKISHELARLEERKVGIQKQYDEIISRLWEEYELTRREAEETGTKIEDPAQAQKRLNEIKSRIKSLGSVNVAAVDEYKEVSERYEFLSAQIADVEKSRDELRGLIGGLTHRMRELFAERFVQIAEHFQRTFRELFGGGTAALSLNTPDDILNSGIEISVQPPGKIVTHLESLSGGEKALVAIALYFAIMKVNPPPFCVLDEIEAALDDVNVGRFASYLRRMNEKTQFIVITHRRGSMEEADVLYGVTMQDEGVSKLLELRASELESRLGMKEEH